MVFEPVSRLRSPLQRLKLFLHLGTEVSDPAGQPLGVVTSGGFGPTVGAPIALGYVPAAQAAPATPLQLSIRGKPHPAKVAALPFVPHRYQR